jgi:hypothetical protein
LNFAQNSRPDPYVLTPKRLTYCRLFKVSVKL